MTYAAGNPITAADYNSLATSVNSVWATTYGQTAIPANLAAGSQIAASQWSTLTSTLNSCLSHQSGTAPMTLPTAGSVATFSSQLSTGITTANTNKYLSAAPYRGVGSYGSVIGSNSTVVGTDIGHTFGTTVVRFESIPALTQFFKAGGRIKRAIVATPNASTEYNNQLSTFINQSFNSVAFGYTDTVWAGTAGNLTTDNRIGFQGVTLLSNNSATVHLLTVQPNFAGAQNAVYNNGWAIDVYLSITGGALPTDMVTVQFTVTFRQLAPGFVPSDNLQTWQINYSSSMHVNDDTVNLTNSWGTITGAA